MKIEFTSKEVSYLLQMVDTYYENEETQPKSEKKTQESVIKKLRGARWALIKSLKTYKSYNPTEAEPAIIGNAPTMK